jgi:threonine aldolase
MNFASDNIAGAHPAILAAVATANDGPAGAYGADAVSARLDDLIAERFGKRAAVFPVSTGTAANSLVLATLAPPWGAILCHREAHIETDECGAPEFFTGGSKLVLGDGPDAKLSAERVEEMLTRNRRGVHSVTPKALSISQLSERGCAYRPEELSALGSICRREGLAFHVDGARFANAAAFLQADLAVLSWKAGVDALCLGATKNGALAAEAVLLFDDQKAEELAFRRKRAGHLICKQRFVAAQLVAYLEDDLWLKLAGRANRLAQQIGAAGARFLSNPVEGNQVFVRPGPEGIAALRAQGVTFYDWGRPSDGEGRLVVRFDQPEADIDGLCRLLERLG